MSEQNDRERCIEENAREQDREDALKEARAKPGVLEALELWEATKRHLPGNPRPKARTTRLARGANEVFSQPR